MMESVLSGFTVNLQALYNNYISKRTMFETVRVYLTYKNRFSHEDKNNKPMGLLKEL